MSRLSQRVKKLEVVAGVDASGFPPHTPQWLAYWDSWFMKHVNNENPPGKASFAALLALIRSEQPSMLSKALSSEDGGKPRVAVRRLGGSLKLRWMPRDGRLHSSRTPSAQ
jgi:hypothetical protein